MKTGLERKHDDILYFWLKWLIGMDAGRYADDCQPDRLHLHAQWFSHQNDGADYHDVI